MASESQKVQTGFDGTVVVHGFPGVDGDWVELNEARRAYRQLEQRLAAAQEEFARRANRCRLTAPRSREFGAAKLAGCVWAYEEAAAFLATLADDHSVSTGEDETLDSAPAPSPEEFKRFTESLAAREGTSVPDEGERCPECKGDGTTAHPFPMNAPCPTCKRCGGSGVVDALDDTLVANNEPEQCPRCSPSKDLGEDEGVWTIRVCPVHRHRLPEGYRCIEVVGRRDEDGSAIFCHQSEEIEVVPRDSLLTKESAEVIVAARLWFKAEYGDKKPDLYEVDAPAARLFDALATLDAAFGDDHSSFAFCALVKQLGDSGAEANLAAVIRDARSEDPGNASSRR